MQTEQTDSYIDYQQMEDGSRRWLWSIIYQDRLWRAGVEHQYDQAKYRATQSWNDLRRHVGHLAADRLKSAAEMQDEAVPPTQHDTCPQPDPAA